MGLNHKDLGKFVGIAYPLPAEESGSEGCCPVLVSRRGVQLEEDIRTLDAKLVPSPWEN